MLRRGEASAEHDSSGVKKRIEIKFTSLGDAFLEYSLLLVLRTQVRISCLCLQKFLEILYDDYLYFKNNQSKYLNQEFS